MRLAVALAAATLRSGVRAETEDAVGRFLARAVQVRTAALRNSRMVEARAARNAKRNDQHSSTIHVCLLLTYIESGLIGANLYLIAYF